VAAWNSSNWFRAGNSWNVKKKSFIKPADSVIINQRVFNLFFHMNWNDVQMYSVPVQELVKKHLNSIQAVWKQLLF
jgi:hypothetical protein